MAINTYLDMTIGILKFEIEYYLSFDIWYLEFHSCVLAVKKIFE